MSINGYYNCIYLFFFIINNIICHIPKFSLDMCFFF